MVKRVNKAPVRKSTPFESSTAKKNYASIPVKKENFINVSNNRTLLKYFQNIQKYFIYANNFGLALDDEDNLSASGKPILLEKLFVPPNLSARHVSPNQLVSAEVSNKTIDFESLPAVLEENQSLFILGDPGTGKSTLINWLMLSLTNTSDNKIKLAIGDVVPFALILREMSLEDINSWDDLCSNFIKHDSLLTAPFTDDKKTLEQLLEQGQVLFLLDGLDEVTHQEHRERLSRVLLEGMQQYPSCRFVITSRLVGFNQVEWFGFKKTNKDKSQIEDTEKAIREKPSKIVQEVYLSPFNSQQVKRYTANWYRQYVVEAVGRNKLANSLLQRLAKNDGLSHLSRIPVLLNMICFIHSRRGRLPDGRAELYQRIAETYLTGLDRARDLKFKGKAFNYDYVDLSDWLAQLALRMQRKRTEEDQAIMISESEVLNFLEERLEENGFDLEHANIEAQAIIEYLGHRSGIFIPRGQDKNNEEQYAFTHLSFLEYFAAKGMKAEAQFWKDEDWEDYNKKTHASWWNETLILFFEQLDQSRQTESYLASLFGKNPLDGKVAYEKIHLLAEIIIDSGVRLLSKKREKWIEELWRFYLEQQSKVKFPYQLEAGLASVGNTLWTESYKSQTRFASLAKTYEKIIIPFDNLSEITLFKDFTKLKILDLSNSQVSDISPLSFIKGLQELGLDGTQVNNIRPLSCLIDLQILYFSGTQVRDISSLSSLKKLYELGFSNAAVDDITPLSCLKNLRELGLSKTQISDITPLSSLKNLQKLYLSKTQISDITPLSSLKNLQKLYLWQTRVSDIKPLSSLESLQELYLNKTEVSDIKFLSSLKNLQELGLSETEVRDITPLSSLKNLQELGLSETEVRDITPLSSLKNLQELGLNETGVSDITPLSSLKNLQVLDLSETEVSDIAPLSFLKNLQDLGLSETQVSDITPLSSLKNLQKLYLRQTQVNDVSSLLSLKKLKRLGLDQSLISAAKNVLKQKGLFIY